MNVSKIGILAASSLFVLTACTGQPAPVANPQIPTIGSSQPTTTTTTTTPTTTSETPPPASSDTPQPKPDNGLCRSSILKLSIRDGDAAAGTVYRNLVFTNVSSAPCTIQGFPGVSYVTGDNGQQVGEPAVRVGSKGTAIKLGSGQSAVAPVGFAQVGNFDPAACKPTEVRGLRVYPPQETASMFVPLAGTGCAGNPPGQQLSVKTIQST
ncbi:DUF4232 domain-containing protein [Kibdelosporangium philippinense]|uniref:DUF4232 domain-containing protein n=2 Tax=Kibdelosporangium philippinense TaxID=211113 RepID=A0ABS8ZGF8_9PSEU|nr:DUF4232 domain-containing protein [Kibdelosporangium philippinense]MCE7004917.1 DUF4232 domain-containing protein [Kibdelosporangium philippinense]